MHWIEPASAEDSHADLEKRLWDAANKMWADAALKPSECPSWGFPISRGNMPAVCPKYDEDLIRAKSRKPQVVDLAHRGETVSQLW